MAKDNPEQERLSYRKILHETALKAPSSSGVYMWKNPQDVVIYVGKAKNLKNRLTSYFSSNKDIKTRLLVSHAKSIEYITTANEYEAFLLENNLIKKYTPRYNINLKDGKSYPVLRITNEEFPRIFKTRTIFHDGSTYFGPYPDSGALDTFIEAIYNIYPVRHCKIFRKKESPCLYYHIGQCKAPCCSKISKESYNEYFGEISSLLEGKGEETKNKIEKTMKKAAEELNFEKAARLRDALRALTIMQNQNVVESFDNSDRDYIAYWREGEAVSFTVLKIRGGKLLGRDNHRVTSLNEDEELIGEFINVYYTSKDELPPAIYVPFQEFADSALSFLQKWFKESFDDSSKIIAVSEGIENYSHHKALIQMASQNAKEDIIRRLRERGDFPALEELKSLLHLSRLPVRIEGFDIAHIAGKFPVASLISFYNGNPDKKNYRYFRLNTTNGIIDDFKSMKEATSRRYTRLINENQELPDLILIDGGIGQVNAVQSVLSALNLDIPVAGLAKRDEEIWLPHSEKPIVLPKRSDALRLLQRVRDETHRFATSRNQRLRTKENVVSVFTKIHGIGEKKALSIIKNFTTLENFCTKSPEEIKSVLKLPESDCEQILTEAKKLLEKQNEIKDNQRKALKESGTTVQNAAYSAYIDELAKAALSSQKHEQNSTEKDKKNSSLEEK